MHKVELFQVRPLYYDLAGIPFASPTDPYQQILYRATNFNNPFWAVENNKFDEKTSRSLTLGSMTLTFGASEIMMNGGSIHTNTHEERY